MRLVHGVGLNDSESPVTRHEKVGGKDKIVWRCKFYDAWTDMLERCYSKKLHALHPTYIGCAVSGDWHKFSAFRSWMITQPWHGKHLDKDILSRGNKLYSPSTCVFIDGGINNFLIDSGAARGGSPIGVYWNERDEKYQAKCSNPFTGRQVSLGYFSCPNEAHKAWLAKKHQYAMQLAERQSDQRVAAALRARYAPGTIHL